MTPTEKLADLLIKYTVIVFICTCLLPHCTQATICSPSNTAAQNKNIVVRGPNMGTVTSPNFPNSFPLDLLCRWKFIAPPGHVVKLYIGTINLDVGFMNCLYMPYLAIYDGLKDKKAPRLLTIKCRNNQLRESLKPSFFVLSSGDSMEMYFQSSATSIYPVKKTGYGFTANYTFEPLDTSGTCGEGRTGTINLRGQGARFNSPDYKSSTYLKNMTCLWNITADPGFIIEIDTVSIKLNNDCESEFVKVYDGTSVDSPILGTMCKEKPSHNLYSSGNSVIVKLKISSSDQRGKGFQMSYRAVKYARPTYACQLTNDKRSVINVDKPTGKVMSPWYPTGYPNNAFCRWSFSAPSFSSVARATINNLHLQDSAGCKADYVSIDGRDDYSLWGKKRLLKLCGKAQTPLSIVSGGRYLEITFNSDWIGQDPGFEAVFDSIEDDSFRGCSVQGQDNYLPLNSSSGGLFSPRYPKPMPPNMMCTWVITAKEGSYIRLHFNQFRLGDPCSSGSSLEIRDGPSGSSKRLGMYCSFRLPPPIFSSGRHLWVQFTSKSKVNSLSEDGFNATYSTVGSLPLSMSCRGESVKEIGTPTGQIASYEYPLHYGINVMCKWRIMPSLWGKKIKLTFDSFDIQKTPGCTGDFVEVFDGWDDDDQSLGKFCGNEKPAPLYSTGTFMHIRFQSDNQTGQYTGFKASYETVLNKTSMILIAVGSAVAVIIVLCIIAYVVCKYRRSERGSRMEMENLKS